VERRSGEEEWRGEEWSGGEGKKRKRKNGHRPTDRD